MVIWEHWEAMAFITEVVLGSVSEEWRELLASHLKSIPCILRMPCFLLCPSVCLGNDSQDVFGILYKELLAQLWQGRQRVALLEPTSSAHRLFSPLLAPSHRFCWDMVLSFSQSYPALSDLVGKFETLASRTELSLERWQWWLWWYLGESRGH